MKTIIVNRARASQYQASNSARSSFKAPKAEQYISIRYSSPENV